MSCPARLYPLRTPRNHRLPIPRWRLALPSKTTHVFTAYIGIQRHSDDDVSQKAETQASLAIKDWLLRSSDEPAAFESFTLIEGGEQVHSSIWVCYWLDRASYHHALEDLSLATLWSKTQAQGRASVGIWRESFVTPVQRLETNYSGLDYLPGLARVPGATTEEHGLSAYWGAARDRIPDSAHDLFPKATRAAPPTATATATLPGIGQHLTGKNYHNMVHIRSGQFWSNCGQQEADAYERKLEPTLHDGLRYLWENPRETEAIGVRYLRNTNTGGGPSDGRPRKETCGAAFFSCLDSLEQWAKTHPSHLAIYRGAMAHYKAFGDLRRLRTWHEVSVIREGDAHFEYINCVPETGMIGAIDLQVEGSWQEG